jgi:hypothetical protein
METVTKGDVAYIPQGYGHSIENIGAKSGRIPIGLNTGNYQAIDLSQWMAGTPSYVLADHFGKPLDVFERFPKERASSLRPTEWAGARSSKTRSSIRMRKLCRFDGDFLRGCYPWLCFG